MLQKLILLLSAPIRYCVRRELREFYLAQEQDIGVARMAKALSSSADYVDKYMPLVVSVDSNLALLTEAFEHADANKEGLIAEFGVFSGRTINHIASLTNEKIFGFDSFEGLPERWRDGFDTGSFNVDGAPNAPAHVSFVQGWFDESLPKFLEGRADDVKFLHIDCDLYSSTKTIFECLADRIKPGCVIVFDEYFNYPGWQEGEYKAFQEFISLHDLTYQYIGYNRAHEQVAVKIT